MVPERNNKILQRAKSKLNGEEEKSGLEKRKVWTVRVTEPPKKNTADRYIQIIKKRTVRR